MAQWRDGWGDSDEETERKTRNKAEPRKFRHTRCGCKPGPKGRTCELCRRLNEYDDARDLYERKLDECETDSTLTKKEQQAEREKCAGKAPTWRRWLLGYQK